MDFYGTKKKHSNLEITYEPKKNIRIVDVQHDLLE